MKNIFLIGMPSSGKTTLGKELAKHIRYRFIDTDHLIEKNEGMTVAEIFDQKGEPYFRQCEHDVLREIRPNSKLIVSTGGGMPCFFDNIDYINAQGISVFLNVPLIELYDRMTKHSTNHRPHYKDTGDELLNNLNKRFESRESIYKKAQIELHSPITVKNIIEKLQNIL